MIRLLLCIATLLVGCATSDKVTEAMLQAHMQAQAQPTLSIRCPSGGCEVTYTDPRDRQQFRAPTNGWDAVTSVGNAAVGLVQAGIVPVALGAVAVKGMQELAAAKGPTTTTTTNTTTTNTRGDVSIDRSDRSDNSNRSTTNTRGDVSIDRSDRSNRSTTTSPTTTIGANSGANSGNSGRIAGTTMTDNTSTPTVVTQPSPVVVQPPAPPASGPGG